MIVENGLPETGFKPAALNREFHVEAPSSSPLVASSGLSLSKEDDRVSIEWTGEEPVLADEMSARVREEFISRCRRDLLKYPNSARAHTNLGIALMNQQQFAAAVGEFEKALLVDPHSYIAAMKLAKLRVEQNQLDEAERLYSKLQETFPNESAPSLSLAFIAMRRFKFDEAEQLFRRAIDVGAEGVLPKYLLSMVLLRLGKNREAINLLKASVRSDVRSPALHQALGAAYAMSGDYSRAELNFSVALKLVPTLPSAIDGLARVLLEQGKTSRALQLLTHYLEQAPKDIKARELLGATYGAIGQYRPAISQLTQVFNEIVGDPSDSATQNRKAALSTSIGTYWCLDWKDKEGEKWLTRAIELSPKSSALPYQHLARLHLRNDRAIDAYRILMTVKSLFPHDQDTNVLLAAVYEDQGMYEKGIRELQPLVGSGLAQASVYSYLGCLLSYSGDVTAAAKVLREGLEKYPESTSIIHNLAFVLLVSGEVAEGRQILERYSTLLEGYAKESSSYEPILMATWGLVYLLEGNNDLGVQAYKQATKLAFKMGDRRLAGAILQKMHAELARKHIHNAEYEDAVREISAGLAIKLGRVPFRRELEILHNSLKDRFGV
jgi:Flp pilus assembly protein TadD